MRSEKDINDMLDLRYECERDILYDYYKRVKLLSNEDARSAVASHFGNKQQVITSIKEHAEKWVKKRQ